MSLSFVSVSKTLISCFVCEEKISKSDNVSLSPTCEMESQIRKDVKYVTI